MTKRLAVILLAWFAAQGCGADRRPSDDRGLSFRRVSEPREGAFTLLAPEGWAMEGGIFRVNAAQAGGPLNALEAKCDLTLKKDAEGSVSMRILPDVVYAHAGIGAGFWGAGANYQGAVVRPLEDAATHIRSLFEASHPGASSVQFLKVASLPGEVESMDRSMAYMNSLFRQIGIGGMAYRADAAGAVVEYEENGRRYREVWCAGIVDQRAALTWKNTRTLCFRAPVESFDRWRPVMDIIRFSIRFNPAWILKEAEGQKERAEIVIKVFEEIRRIDGEIAARSRINREEIMNDNFLVLTGQEEYVNPHTGAVETDTDAYRYRWVSGGGDVYYTNEEEADPNRFMTRTDYRKTPVRPRRNE